MSSSERHNIGIQFTGKSWEPVRSVPVDREGEYAFSLRPKTEKLADRVVCEVTVEDNIKIITIRSTYKIENQTLYPLELTLVNKAGQPTYSVEKIGKYKYDRLERISFSLAPGQEYALPLEAVTKSNVRIQPDRELHSP
jgi:vacuolar protein sorting-associated protein 13A/C